MPASGYPRTIAPLPCGWPAIAPGIRSRWSARILSGNYTALGVGYTDDGTGMKYFTMVFIGPPL